MQNTKSLDSLQERVSSIKDLLDAKKTLNEVFINFYLSQLFTESGDGFRNDVAYLAILFNDLLDDLFTDSLQKQLHDAGIN